MSPVSKLQQGPENKHEHFKLQIPILTALVNVNLAVTWAYLLQHHQHMRPLQGQLLECRQCRVLTTHSSWG